MKTKPKVLLVDDDATVTRALEMYLVENGDCDVRVENTGSRALSTARAYRPDIIFLDVVMPDANGGDLAAEMSADPVLNRTPIIFLTALVSRSETGGGTKQIGKYPFLAKPVDPDTLLAYIDQHTRA